MSRGTLRVLPLVAAALVAALLAEGPVAAEDAADPEVKALVAKLADPDEGARAAAADDLVKRGAAAVPALVAAAADTAQRAAIVPVLGRMGPAAKDAVPALTGFVRGPQTAWRPASVRALGAIGADAATATSALAGIVGQRRAKDRADAVASIRAILADVARHTPRAGGPTPVDRAVAAGCDWLGRHQAEDGRWSSSAFAERCAKEPRCTDPGQDVYDIGVTGLAVLALLGGHGRDDDAPDAERTKTVDAGLAWLASTQTDDGFLGSKASIHFIYNHGCGSLALAEAYRRTHREDLRGPVERAVKAVLSIQSAKGGGWRYTPSPSGDSDTSVTTWMVSLLRTAADGGIQVDPAGVKGALRWIEEMTEPEFGRAGYQNRGGPSARTVEMQQRFPASESEALTACALLVRLEGGQPRTDEMVRKQLDLIAKRRPSWDPARGTIDLYYWMHASAAVRLAGGSDYTSWRTMLVAALLPHQHLAADGCAAGSWDGADPWSPEGGRVYATSAALLALQACDDDPATRPPLPGAHNAAVRALEKALDDDDRAFALVARRALDTIRDAFR